jgi:sec-independent protein translocase protein TatB
MFSVSHMIVLFVVVLVVFGPHKLPELARGLGKLMAEFRKASTDFKLAFEEEMRNVERQAREAERKKQQETASGAATEESASNPVEEPTPQLPETIEPVVAPVNEAVARGSEELESTETLDAAKGETAREDEAAEKAVQDQGHPA